LVLAATLASVRGGAASKPTGVALGEGFELKIDDTARVESEELELGFAAVPSDSRCPKGERCIHEGDATVHIWLQKGEEPKQTLELHTSSRDEGVASNLGYEVRLLRLDPYPVSGKSIARGDYLATLEVSGESSALATTRAWTKKGGALAGAPPSLTPGSVPAQRASSGTGRPSSRR